MSAPNPPMKRSVIFWALILAALISLPTLFIGFVSDDNNLILLLEGKLAGLRRGIDLYRFLDGSRQTLREFIAHGPFPWWTAPDLKIAFFRPLAAILLVADHALFGRNAAWYHIHSIVWYVALCAVVAMLFRRTLPAKTATLALFMFVVNDSHVQATGWIANRHCTVAAVFTMAGLLAHIRARSEGWRPGWVLSPLGFALGLSTSEAAIGGFAYLFAFEIFGRSDSISVRIKALVPGMLLLGSYLILYRQLGYGTAHSSGYIDPIGNTASFLAVAPGRAGMLACSFLIGPPADLMIFGLPGVTLPFIVLGIGFTGLVAWLLHAAAQNPAEAHTLSIRWLTLGAVLSVVPSLGAVPGDRILLVPSIGGVAGMAAVLCFAAQSRGRIARIGFYFLVLLFGLRPPIFFALNISFLYDESASARQVARAAELPRQANHDLVVLAASDPTVSFEVATVRELESGIALRSWWILSMASYPHRVVRTAPDTLELQVEGNSLLDSTLATLFYDPKHRFHVGDMVPLAGAQVRIVSEQAGNPTRISVQFDRPLEDPSLWFVTQQNGTLRKVIPPALGQTLQLP